MLGSGCESLATCGKAIFSRTCQTNMQLSKPRRSISQPSGVLTAKSNLLGNFNETIVEEER